MWHTTNRRLHKKIRIGSNLKEGRTEDEERKGKDLVQKEGEGRMVGRGKLTDGRCRNEEMKEDDGSEMKKGG
jgi:hypothetical protein